MQIPTNQIMTGDCRSLLPSIASDSVDCIVTSPPYYKQRDYRTQAQLGNEKDADTYIKNLVAVFSECRRALKPTGTFWLNLGDKYQDGRLLGLPWRVALQLVQEGWILRADIIWHKPNAMPHSVKNRPTVDHEYLFFFAKTDDYYYDADAIREPHVTFSARSRMRGGRNHFGKRDGTPEKGKNQGNSNLHDGRWDQAFHPAGRNKRTVWSVPLGKCREAHFAVFPEALIEPCILAGSPPRGLVLDPFLGTGTVAVVAKANGRSFLGIELSPDYVAMAKRRLADSQVCVFV
jgi:site-specific DNA-methyltransferase (adenine-specific)